MRAQAAVASLAPVILRAPASAADASDLISEAAAEWRALTPDDPSVDGVACHHAVPE